MIQGIVPYEHQSSSRLSPAFCSFSFRKCTILFRSNLPQTWFQRVRNRTLHQISTGRGKFRSGRGILCHRLLLDCGSLSLWAVMAATFPTVISRLLLTYCRQTPAAAAAAWYCDRVCHTSRSKRSFSLTFLFLRRKDELVVETLVVIAPCVCAVAGVPLVAGLF